MARGGPEGGASERVSASNDTRQGAGLKGEPSALRYWDFPEKVGMVRTVASGSVASG